MTCGSVINTYKILVGKPKGKRPVGITRSRWESRIKLVNGTVLAADTGWGGDWRYSSTQLDLG